jgi:hypothetical protein
MVYTRRTRPNEPINETSFNQRDKEVENQSEIDNSKKSYITLKIKN